VCGNNVLELGEACDDGNLVATDGCTDECRVAICGDGIVRTGVEECDDANVSDEDCCTSLCKEATCGDGIVGCGEQCDDALDPTGCASCMPVPVTCGTSGMVARIEVPYASVGAPALRGVRVDVTYPEATSLPLVGGDFVDPDRFTDVTGLQNSLLVGQAVDRNMDGTRETLDLVFNAAAGTFPSGPLVATRFDCTPNATITVGHFSCVVTGASDQVGNPVNAGGVPCAVTRVGLP
jgi:cysteine-rich repeat protein